ncbi:hypothetical protein EHI8A_114330 [Entamoeba histolytica HM-1:IMSS-B]|uniref:UBX domain-containing protein n=6 Tax=Entamoeba histolytica TaxID=5759 RepID=C4M4D4_ENTH1|nr:hypothetical protein, conserved [Entamoeba histolytica HM-1:IMSS]EMD45131.1 Hypothetical protein EHI5A_154060 [Entamoeba histolytica KU27]EMH78055.1 hypothetical protein EHI8A_114330 [Entamoeba histolytica HM-1:IMSS-B]EMS14939.1 hypothetical protein KM1_186080 [Entamoeba histolytica HM-3:IMSS]ENY64396.1 hypothetical protein EHI7A_139550 [Entamoeba histolytica HM-1:IMSS-A]GAT96225.1 hypothetical protein conserved [Entamoeba histolytica]|eukprot:XP_652922.2 hypothetical protein, conserved [Entamoeba histolytica HM-1:IMSS]
MNIWYEGNISDEITKAFTENKIIVIIAINDNEESLVLKNLIENNLSTIFTTSCSGILIKENTENMTFFRQLYKNKVTFPSLFLFNKNGLSTVLTGEKLTVPEITSSIVQCALVTLPSPQNQSNISKKENTPTKALSTEVSLLEETPDSEYIIQQRRKESQELEHEEKMRREKNRQLLEEKRKREEIKQRNEEIEMKQQELSDKKYAERVTLEILAEKEQQKQKVREEELRVREAEEKKKQEELERKNEMKKFVQVAFRLPSSETIKQPFEKTDTLADCFAFLETKGYKKREIELLNSLKRTPLNDEKLKLEVFYPSIVIYVVKKKELGVVKKAENKSSNPSDRVMEQDQEFQQRNGYQALDQQETPQENVPKNKFLRFMKGFLTGK